MVTVALEMHIMSKKHACRQPALLPAAPALCPPLPPWAAHPGALRPSAAVPRALEGMG